MTARIGLISGKTRGLQEDQSGIQCFDPALDAGVTS